MHRHQVCVHMTPHDAIVAALTMEAVIDIFDRSGAPVYEPLVFARVCTMVDDYQYKEEVTTFEFLKTLAILEAAHHIHRVKRHHVMVHMVQPHVIPTDSGRKDAMGAREKLREIMHAKVQ